MVVKLSRALVHHIILLYVCLTAQNLKSTLCMKRNNIREKHDIEIIIRKQKYRGTVGVEQFHA